LGYGHSTPRTVGGKIFCMFYALVGIPLNLVMFQSIGERLNIFVTFVLKTMKKCLKVKNLDVSETNLIMISMNMSSLVLLGGAAAFSYWENWTYIDSFYYCFITLTTIGFGDFVALQKDSDLQKRPDYVAFSLIFILFGLTVVSAAMNLLVLRFLTMNTEDERKEEMQAAAAARTAVRLEGDVITANGSVQQTAVAATDYTDLTSVCSCSCYNFRSTAKHRYTVTRSPGKISHLLPMQTFTQNGSNSAPYKSAS
ncbi:Two pore potassium channel protein sup-9, partial [Lamellibrachia satsuma]